MDFERDKREVEQRREAERGLPPEPRVGGDRYVADDARMGTGRASSGGSRSGVGLEEEARMEETVRRGTRRAMDEKEQEPSSGGLYGSQIDDAHMVGAGLAELVGTFILVYGGTAVAVGAILARPTAGAAYDSLAIALAFATWLTFGAAARSEANLAATYPAQGVGDLQAFIVEVLITFILVFVVMAVATDDRAPAAIAPIAVGFALAVGVFIAGPVTGGAVNPVRALGPMIVAGDLTSAWLYILGPIVGGVLAALLYDRTMAETEAPA